MPQSSSGADAAPRDGSPTFVLVHGAHSNAAVWSPLVRELAFLGHRALAVDLPGHGVDAHFPLSYQAPQDLAAFAAQPSPLAELTLADNVAHVVEAVRRLARFGPVVLVGSSAGGATITGVGNAVPELLGNIVYASAWCCVDLPSMADYLKTVGHPGVPLPMINWRTADVDVLAELKHGLMAEATDEQFMAWLNTVEPTEAPQLLTADAQVRADTWGRVPHTYLRFSRDEAIPLAMQDRMIAEADRLTPGNPFAVHTVDTGHVGMWLHPTEIARILTDLTLE
ncbi:alpha/beta hydrolase [Streptomyces sp. NPDC047315]|uniref:alpha/beta fold hydrolase n=1 Tax=Streptomyces sp. NPDC047315 TaxID=3155142 RepID=UPI0033EFA178